MTALRVMHLRAAQQSFRSRGKLSRWFVGALDAFAEARMRAAIPARLRHTLRDIDRDCGPARANATDKRVTRRASSLVSPITH